MRSRNEEILFGEFLTPERRASIRSKVTELCNSVSQGVKKIVFPAHDCVLEETTQPELNARDSVSIRLNFPIVEKYVHCVESAPVSPKGAKPGENAKNEEAGKSVERLGTVYEKIIEYLHGIDGERKVLLVKKRALMNDRESARPCRAALLICFSMKKAMLKLHEKYIESVKQDMTYVLNYVNARQREEPDVELTVDVQALLDRLDGFPSMCEEAMVLKRQKVKMKAHYSSLVRSPTQQITLVKRLGGVFSRCERMMDQQTRYFRDRSDDLNEFETTMDHMKKEFTHHMNERITKCIEEPQLVGAAIIEQCADLARAKHFDYEKTLPITFVLFSRLYFNRIYLRTLATQPPTEDALEFQRRVFRIRKLTPVAIGSGAGFIGAKLQTLRLVDFPKMHMYSAAVNILSQLSYIVCPIDFCKAANDALSVIQAQAQAFSFAEYLHTTGHVVAESEHALSLDQLFDIGLIVFLVSDPVDLQTLVNHFSQYIGALQLPSAFQFGFTNIKAMCDYIMKLDMVKFMEEARHRQELDQEKDPLNILP